MAVITYPDGTSREFSDGAPVSDLLSGLPQGVRKKAVAVRIGKNLCDLREQIHGGGDFLVITTDEEEALDVLRHSASHLMALAVQELFENVKFAIGPSIKEGFYYDFLLDRTFSPEDLEKIENRMNDIRERPDLDFRREVLRREDALSLFIELGQQFKVDLINGLDSDTVSIYKLGTFTDLCTGPHVPDIKMLRHVKLLSLAGAYWRGDEKREMLQRIYGTAFYSGEALSQDLERREEAKKRDHRKLGPQLGLFDIKDEAGGGLVLWYPNGYILREKIEEFWKQEHRKRGYEMIMTPHIAKSDLWKTSGHYDFYRENMFIIKGEDDQEFVLKPMNCPGHILIYKSHLHSYRDLPIRYAELGTVYRNERSGTLHGLLRVRGFTQDDAHIFCTPEQLDKEVDDCFDLAHHILTTFGFREYKVELSVHDPDCMDKYAGSEAEWEMAESSLLKAIEKRGIPYKKMPGEAVFYGPKIDLKLIDAIGRGWQATTIQFDFNLPRRFDVMYVSREGNREYVYMIHRALLGSIERFVGTLTEHYAGLFPLWLAPVQVVVMPIGIAHHEYAKKCTEMLRDSGIRAECDLREEKLGFRIRESEVRKIPYMVICGDQEVENGTLDIRTKTKGRMGSKKIGELITELVDEIDRKA